MQNFDEFMKQKQVAPPPPTLPSFDDFMAEKPSEPISPAKPQTVWDKIKEYQIAGPTGAPIRPVELLTNPLVPVTKAVQPLTRTAQPNTPLMIPTIPGGPMIRTTEQEAAGILEGAAGAAEGLSSPVGLGGMAALGLMTAGTGLPAFITSLALAGDQGARAYASYMNARKLEAEGGDPQQVTAAKTQAVIEGLFALGLIRHSYKGLKAAAQVDPYTAKVKALKESLNLTQHDPESLNWIRSVINSEDFDPKDKAALLSLADRREAAIGRMEGPIVAPGKPPVLPTPAAPAPGVPPTIRGQFNAPMQPPLAEPPSPGTLATGPFPGPQPQAPSAPPPTPRPPTLPGIPVSRPAFDPNAPMPDIQRRAMFAIASDRGIPKEVVEAVAGKKIGQLTAGEAREVMGKLKQLTPGDIKALTPAPTSPLLEKPIPPPAPPPPVTPTPAPPTPAAQIVEMATGKGKKPRRYDPEKSIENALASIGGVNPDKIKKAGTWEEWKTLRPEQKAHIFRKSSTNGPDDAASQMAGLGYGSIQSENDLLALLKQGGVKGPKATEELGRAEARIRFLEQELSKREEVPFEIPELKMGAEQGPVIREPGEEGFARYRDEKSGNLFDLNPVDFMLTAAGAKPKPTAKPAGGPVPKQESLLGAGPLFEKAAEAGKKYEYNDPMKPLGKSTQQGGAEKPVEVLPQGPIDTLLGKKVIVRKSGKSAGGPIGIGDSVGWLGRRTNGQFYVSPEKGSRTGWDIDPSDRAVELWQENPQTSKETSVTKVVDVYAEPFKTAIEPKAKEPTRSAIDQGILSPSGRVSERSHAAAQERVRQELFGEGLEFPKAKQPTEAESLLRRAETLRDLAERGTKPKAYAKEAERLEAKAKELAKAALPEPFKGIVEPERPVEKGLPVKDHIEEILQKHPSGNAMTIGILKALGDKTRSIPEILEIIKRTHRTSPGWAEDWRSGILKLADKGEIVRTWGKEGDVYYTRKQNLIEKGRDITKEEADRLWPQEPEKPPEKPASVESLAGNWSQMEVDRRAQVARDAVMRVMNGKGTWAQKRRQLDLPTHVASFGRPAEYREIPIGKSEVEFAVKREMADTVKATGLEPTRAQGVPKITAKNRSLFGDDAGFIRFKDSPFKDNPEIERGLERLKERERNALRAPLDILPKAGEPEVPGELATSVGHFRSLAKFILSDEKSAPVAREILDAASERKKAMQYYYDAGTNALKGIKSKSEEAYAVFDILDGKMTEAQARAELGANADKVINAASRIRKEIFEPIIAALRSPELEKEIGKVGYIRSYAPHVIEALRRAGLEKPEEIFWNLLPNKFKTKHAKPRDWRMLDYNRDIFTVLPMYIHSTMKTVHDIPAYSRALKTIEILPEGTPYRKLVQWYADNYIGQPKLKGQLPATELIQRVSNRIGQTYYDAYIGANPRMAAINLTQTLTNTYPELGGKYTMIGLKKLLTDPVARKQFHDSGLLFDYPGLESEFSRVSDIKKPLYWMFQRAEYINRGIAYLGAHAKAKDLYMTGRAAERYAIDMVRETNFIYGKEDPIAFLSMLPTASRTFKTFAFKEADFIGSLFGRALKKGATTEDRARLGRFLMITVGGPLVAAAAGIDRKEIQRYGLDPLDIIPRVSPLGNDFVAFNRYAYDVSAGRRKVEDIPRDAFLAILGRVWGGLAITQGLKDLGIIGNKKKSK